MATRYTCENFDDVLRSLEVLEKKPFSLTGSWDAHQHLMHCAQSLQYQLIGFPKEKPKLFQVTIGKAAFMYLDAKGVMNHDTNAFTDWTTPIPKNGLEQGLAFYRNTVEGFIQWKGEYKNHLFFGKLSKKQLIKYHSMHFANHFEQFIF